jgi:hypothetical protein
MKKVIRLTESDLMRIVKRVINESESHEKEFNDRLDNNEDPMIAYYKSQLINGTKLSDLFKIYGEVLAFDLFGGNITKFLDEVQEINNNSSEYPQEDWKEEKLIPILTDYFCQGDEDKAYNEVRKWWKNITFEDDDLDNLEAMR